MTNDNENVFIKKRKRFFRGGNTDIEKRKVITLEEQAAEAVGYNIFFSLSSGEQNELISELLTDGIISAKRASAVFEYGGNVWSDFVHDFEEDGSIYILGSNDNGKNQILAKITPSGRTIYFIEEARDIPEVTELLLQMADEGIYAKGGGVAEPIYVVSYKMKDANKVVEKLFSDMDSAELFHETLEEDEDLVVSPIVERIPETKNPESKLPEQPKKASLFTTAKKAPATAAAKKKRERVEVDGIEDDIKKYDELKAIINNAKAEQEIIGGKLKEIGVDKFIELYEERGSRPANFDLADGAENILLEVTDRYLKVDSEKAELLKNYDGLLEETTTYKFTPELLEKEVANGMTIGEIVSSLIQGTDLISEEDKARLIVAETSMKVKKGTINNLLNYENPRLIFDLIQPILALK